jgi:hypothetical protein
MLHRLSECSLNAFIQGSCLAMIVHGVPGEKCFCNGLIDLSGGLTLTLEQALELALNNNTAVTNAELQQAAAEEDVAALRTTRYPRRAVSRNLETQRYTFD